MMIKRRQFINAMLGAGAVTSFGGATSLIPSLAHAAAPQFDDYKALVVFFMHGGNDSYNMIVPTGSAANTGYDTYATSREKMAVQNVELNPLGLRTDDGRNPYAAGSDAEAYLKGVYGFGGEIGINGVMPELAQLFADGKAAAVANIGTLIEPVTKATLRSSPLPPFLYAHNHQQRAMKTGWADNLAAGGWAGRLADMWSIHEGAVNGGSPLGMNVSFSGATRLMTASFNSPVVLKAGGKEIFTSAGFDPDFYGALNAESALDQPLHRVLKRASRSAVSLSHALGGLGLKWSDGSRAADPVKPSALEDPYGNNLFAKPSSDQLDLGNIGGGALRAAESAVLMAELGKSLGLSRQIIYIDMGGFDNHTDLRARHPLLLRELSLALWSFQQAIQELGMDEQVTLCTMSDFGRSLGNNGDGTDHAWAGHNLVIGGAVNGGKMFGEMPDMELGGSNDTGRKGRMIPAIAVDQYLATLCSWFGVSDDEMPALFPNLGNFKTASSDPISSAYINGLMGGADAGGGVDLPISILDLLA